MGIGTKGDPERSRAYEIELNFPDIPPKQSYFVPVLVGLQGSIKGLNDAVVIIKIIANEASASFRPDRTPAESE